LRILRAALAATFASLALAGTALAADPLQGITASPPKQRIDLTAGGTYSGTVDISNPGTTEYDFTVSASPFSVKGEDYNLLYSQRPDLVDASRWFVFPQARYHLKPTQKVAVRYNVNVPRDAAGGGYYAVVFAQADSLPGAGVSGQKRVGVLTYMTVAGDIQRSGRVLGLSAPVIQTQPPLVGDVRLQNTGNVHYDSTVSVQIKDLFGNVKTELNSDQIIFPKTIRRVPLSWGKAPSFGLYRLSGTVKYLDRTDPLPTRWTLMLSANAFLVIVFVVVVLAVYAYITRRGRRNVRRG
jgi:hypothetical protein